MNHKFGTVKFVKRAGRDIHYRKCQACHKVMFEQGDDYFNLACSAALSDREGLRQELEAI